MKPGTAREIAVFPDSHDDIDTPCAVHIILEGASSGRALLKVDVNGIRIQVRKLQAADTECPKDVSSQTFLRCSLVVMRLYVGDP